MKRVLLSVSFIITLSINAQTLTAADTMRIGDLTEYYSVDSAAANLDDITGSAVTWDYSGVKAYMVPTTNNTIQDGAASASGSDFPAANYVENFTDGVKTYFSNSPTEMTVHGFTYNDGSALYKVKYNSDPLKGLEFPMALGTTYSDDIAGEGDAGLPALVPITGTASVIADGVGTLKLGNTDFTNVIRIKTTEEVNGSVLIGDVEVFRVTYAYYKPGDANSMPIFRIDSLNVNAGAAGVVAFKSAHSRVQINNFVSSEEITAINDFKIFPNPATDITRVVMAEDVEQMTIYNALGKQVYQIIDPASNVQINLAAYESGIYFIELKEGNNYSKQKLVVK